MAKKHGIDVDSIIRANKRKECEATKHEVELLSRACNDERLSRIDVAKTIGKSYRQAYEDGDFDRIKRLRHQGIFSKVSAILLGKELEILNNS
jgi:ribosome assembly protein YihI (activator of Der GTPase)